MTYHQASPMPLTMATVGQQVQIVSIAAGQRATRRLAEMGLIPGCEIEIMQNQGYGPLLLAIRDTRLAIERGIAHKMIVQPSLPEAQPAPVPRSSLFGHVHRNRVRRGTTNA